MTEICNIFVFTLEQVLEEFMVPLLLLPFATTRSVFKVKVSVVCVVQANRCLTSCGEAPQSVQMSLVRLTVTPYACRPEIDGSVLTIVVRECIVVS